MSGTEIVAVVSGVLNIFGAVAGLFGWKKHQEVKEAAERTARAGEAVIQGVEACERILGSDEAGKVKRSVKAAAEAAGVEGFLHSWLARLGLTSR